MSFVTRRALSTLIPPKVFQNRSLLLRYAEYDKITIPRSFVFDPDEFWMDEDFYGRSTMEGNFVMMRFRRLTEFDPPQAIGAAPDAIRMQRVVSFYEKLPRGAAPEVKAKGLLGRYQAKHFGKNPTGKPIIHLIVFLVSIGYVQNYYFHLRHHKNNAH
ncbi:mitochondrial ATP synthase subunit f [Fusarium phyllophilum]|uniref:Mitochondrial ATP synthase subunit f n=2 Tax=Fusarium TaxID=5506 RepID=A0A8H5JRE8_9HYPO|nr:mitochondrial ATP synthase subunit f [Fusarium phyllophilum]